MGVDTYRERLRTVMILRGLGDTEDLARAWRLPAIRVEHLLRWPLEMQMREALLLKDAMSVRASWLIAGQGPMTAYEAHPDWLAALTVLESLPPDRIAWWLRIGRRLSGDLGPK